MTVTSHSTWHSINQHYSGKHKNVFNVLTWPAGNWIYFHHHMSDKTQDDGEFDIHVTVHHVKFLIINQLDALVSQIYS
jgi:hypothetical protein